MGDRVVRLFLARPHTEMYRSGHNENDSKSFGRDERPVGSNPTISAISGH